MFSKLGIGEAKYLPLTDDMHDGFRTKMLAVFKQNGYTGENIEVKKSLAGDLHANASVTGKRVILGEPLFTQHKDHHEEILAICCHELGHLKMHHITKMMVINMFYMLVIGLFMVPLIDNPYFLNAFNIHMESYVMTLWLVYITFTYSVHFIMTWFLNFYSRNREIEADAYAIKCGYGKEIYMALIRNFSMNKKFLFESELKNLLSTHPTTLRRLSAVKKRLDAGKNLQETTESNASVEL